VIEVNRVQFSYGDLAVLRGVNLKLNHGECVALVGRNGGGKRLW
jgi:Cu-processing system ATP-binding protein